MKPQFTTQTENTGNNMVRFVFEPLPQGYGQTLGTALRRVLYSSIRGAAITSIQISGASHQFSTLPGVMEDLVRLVLNLKQVRVTYTGDKPTKISLSAKGEGVVKASDFETGSEVEIANPDFVIANLTDKSAKLEIEAVVEAGYGYSSADERKSSTVGVIPIDAMFSPVVRANVQVEATRVGRMTNFDKLTLDVTTDGTVSAQDAVEEASKILVDYFMAIVTPQKATASTSNSASKPVASGNSSISIEELDLPTRIANALQKAGFETVSDLLATTSDELAKVKNVGSKSVKLIEAALNERGITLS